MTDDADHIWNAVKDELRQAVPADTYDIWLAPLRLVAIEDDVVLIEAPRELRAWVAEHYAGVLQASVAAVLGPRATVDLRVGGSGCAARADPSTPARPRHAPVDEGRARPATT